MGITRFDQIEMSFDVGTSTAAAATVQAQQGLITTESLVTAAGITYSFTLTNRFIQAGGTQKTTSLVWAQILGGSFTTGQPTVVYTKAAAGTATILVKNVDGAAALNGTLIIGFLVLNSKAV